MSKFGEKGMTQAEIDAFMGNKKDGKKIEEYDMRTYGSVNPDAYSSFLTRKELVEEVTKDVEENRVENLKEEKEKKRRRKRRKSTKKRRRRRRR